MPTTTKLFTRTCNDWTHLRNLIKWAERHDCLITWYVSDGVITAEVFKNNV